MGLLVFVAMCLQDILGTSMVVFESHFDANLAGIMDVLGYIAGLVCSVLALDSILKDGWRTKRSLVILISVSFANYAGTWAGVLTGSVLLHHVH